MARFLTELPDEHADAIAWIGFTLVIVQAAERSLAWALQLPLHQGELITVESLEHGEAATRRKTLGQLLRELRKRATIDPQFDEVLARFLEHRNLFVHGLAERYDLSTIEGRESAVSFLRKLGGDAKSVVTVLTAVVVRWVRKLEEASGGTFQMPWEATGAHKLHDVWDLVPIAEHAVRRAERNGDDGNE